MRAMGRAPPPRQVARVGGEMDLGVVGFQNSSVKEVAKEPPCLHCSLMRSQLQELEARLEHTEETLEDDQRHDRALPLNILATHSRGVKP